MIYTKKAEVSPIAIMVIIVIAGLIIFFGLKLFGVFDKNESPNINVTKINDSATSTAIQYVAKSGGINISDGKDLTLKNPVENITLNNNTNKTLVKVIYPNKTLTPGSIMSINLTEICVSGYSERVRNVSDKMRDWIYIEYRLSPDQPTDTFQIDHLIPLSIGGNNDEKNLWPQPRDPRPGYKEKDVLENYYHRQVCDGKMDIKEAQAIMANNWFSGYLQAKAAGGIK